ncbi:hypothetical protein ACSSWA_05810 [Melioribacter sp. Ez-97]|jgi:hypothetical protein|uniref:hypothetical protein n=1 Tax=Melioribacter sp. Ez-97 TaxID=3423434 RepID=UPI003EDA8CD0
MKRLEPYPVAVSLFFIFTIFYGICISIGLILTDSGSNSIWQMHKIWLLFLPGFNGLDSLSILIGLLEVSVGSYAFGYITFPIYNYLLRDKFKKNSYQPKLIYLRFKSLFLSFAVFLILVFTLCVVYDILMPPQYSMIKIWEILLPGFKSLNFYSYLLGIVEIIIYSAYTALIISGTLNYFEKSKNAEIS